MSQSIDFESITEEARKDESIEFHLSKMIQTLLPQKKLMTDVVK